MSAVSVLIPVYNSVKHIHETIQSVLDQSFGSIEIIVVDDGSTDDSLQLLNSIKRSHNIQIYSEKNKGACAARNKAFELSSGKYIQFLDADDIISPEKISNQIKLFEKYGNDIVVSGQWGRFYNDPKEAQFPTRFLDRDWNDPVDWLINAWEGKGMAQTSVWLTPRHLIEKAGPWDERLKVNQDGEFFSRVLLQAKSIKFCKESKVYYRSGNESTVSKIISEEKAASLLLSYQLYKKSIHTHLDNERVRHALMMNFLGFIYRFYGKYPDLIKTAKEEINMLGFEKLPSTGGRNFKRIASFIGFENALKIRNVLKRH